MTDEPTNKTDQPFWIAFSRIPGIGAKKITALADHFGLLRDAWEADTRELRRAGLGERDALTVMEQRKTLDPEKLYTALAAMSIDLCTLRDPRYPPLLKEIYSPPAVLYLRGTFPDLPRTTLAVVGTRKTSPYGRAIAPRIVHDLAANGIVIVSGLALGIDALAHQSAIEANGTTLAVLGCGLDAVYPRSNAPLADRILASAGALLSEYPPGTLPLKQNFPARNRIISGLSRGVLVIEGGEDSGSLITAQFAVEQNRDVFAVPGNISSESSRGPNKLIQMGAALVTCADDVLQALGWRLPTECPRKPPFEPANDAEAAVLRCLSATPVHIDEIIGACKLEASVINATLAILEIKGAARHAGGMQYTLTHT